MLTHSGFLFIRPTHPVVATLDHLFYALRKEVWEGLRVHPLFVQQKGGKGVSQHLHFTT